MSREILLRILPLAAAAAIAGFAFGLAYFAALRRSVALFCAGRGWRAPAGMTLARIALAALALGAAARLGAVPLLGVFAGFLAARAFALRRAWR